MGIRKKHICMQIILVVEFFILKIICNEFIYKWAYLFKHNYVLDKYWSNRMNSLEKLELGCFGVVITGSKCDENIGATISSNMKEDNTPENKGFNLSVDALESLILSHYSAGVDVSCPKYLQGIETALDALGNNEPDVCPEIDSLHEALSYADLLTIDGDLFRNFNIFEFDKGVDDVDNALCLDAGSFQFTFDEIYSATRMRSSVWLVKSDGQEYQLVCEKVEAL